MRTNLENPRIYEARLSGIRHSTVTSVLTGTFVVPDEGPTVWAFDAGLADKAVRLPALTKEKQIVVGNVGSTNALNITDSAGNALITLQPQGLVIFFATAVRWVWTVTAFASGPLGITTLTGSSAVLATDVNVQVNSAGVAVLTLPTSVAWLTASGARGLPLSIFDISGAASANNITINPSGGQTISGLASLVISTDYGGFRMMPKTTGGWVVV